MISQYPPFRDTSKTIFLIAALTILMVAAPSPALSKNTNEVPAKRRVFLFEIGGGFAVSNYIGSLYRIDALGFHIDSAVGLTISEYLFLCLTIDYFTGSELSFFGVPTDTLASVLYGFGVRYYPFGLASRPYYRGLLLALNFGIAQAKIGDGTGNYIESPYGFGGGILLGFDFGTISRSSVVLGIKTDVCRLSSTNIYGYTLLINYSWKCLLRRSVL